MPVIAFEFWRHGLQPPAMEEIQKERLHHVIEVVPQCQFVGTDAPGKGVQNAAAKSRTDRTSSLSCRREPLHDTVSVFFKYVIFDAETSQISW